MTDEEKTKITGQVVFELAETKRTLACLEAKAERMSLEFGLLANWLRGHFPSGVELDSTLSGPDALKLVEEIKDTKARVERLEERRAQLGSSVTRGKPVLDPERDLKGATPEKLARALLRQPHLAPRRGRKPVGPDEVAVEEVAPDEPGDGVPHLEEGV